MIPLPLELFRPIVASINSRRDLLSLIRTSHTLRDEAERALYAHPNLYFRHPDAQARFLNHITYHERHALLVRKISIHISINPPLPGELNAYARDWAWDAFIPPLNSLVHLRHLVVTVGSSPHEANLYAGRTYGRIFDQTVFQLHSLVCTFHVDAKMSKFVARQKELRYLEWNSPPAPHIPIHSPPVPGLNVFGPPLFDDGLLPRLRCLSADFSILKNLINSGRGHSLRALQVNSSVLTPARGNPYLRELEGLEILSLWSREPPENGWITVFSPEHAELLPNLRNLECTIGRAADERTLIQALSQLTKLKVLKLHNSMHSPNYRDNQLMSFVPRIFDATAISASMRLLDSEQVSCQSLDPNHSTAYPSLNKINLGLGTGLIKGRNGSVQIMFEGWSFDRATGKRNPKKEEIGWHSWTWGEVSDVTQD